MSERKLKAWQAAGLIDEPTVARILQWEEENSRPWGVWALIGLGALAIGLGFISVVAANWDAIAGEVRIAIHFVLMACFAAFIGWHRLGENKNGIWFQDAMLFILGAMGLTFFGHIGQVYQTSSPLWQPLLAWLALFTPLLLGYGRGWPVALMWFIGVIGTAWSHAQTGEYVIDAAFGGRHEEAARSALYWGLIASPPMLISAFTVFIRGRSQRSDFWRKLEQLAFITILFGVSAAIVTAYDWSRYAIEADEKNVIIQSVLLQSFFILLAAGATWILRKTKSGRATAGILSVAAIVLMFSSFLGGISLNSAIFFMLLWAGVAYGAIYAGWRRVFQIAVAILALRLIIINFEFADDLLGSGIGLILAGIMTLGIAWLAIRISRKYAPKAEVGI
jgi:hypothetical protein